MWRVLLLSEAQYNPCLYAQAEEREGALKACMTRVADLQAQLADALETHEKVAAKGASVRCRPIIASQ